MNRLDDKVAIITGAAGGIGVAAAQLFTAAGAKVLMVDRDAGALEAAAATVEGEVSHFAADVTEPAQAEAYVAAALERYGAVDALLANAGIEGGTDPIVDCAVEDFDLVMAGKRARRVVGPQVRDGGDAGSRRRRQHRHHLIDGRRDGTGRHGPLPHQQARRLSA